MLIFEKTKKGRKCVDIKKPEVEKYNFDSSFLRENDANLPEVAEIDLVRHYSNYAGEAKGVDNVFYPLGSCTMKYNPKLNEEVASLKGFNAIHPLQDEVDVQGALEVMYTLSERLKEITGMDAVSLQPFAGAQGEYSALKLIEAYHKENSKTPRTKIIVPDSAHGTNPASARLAGYEVLNVKSNSEYGVDLDELKKVVGDDTAALMLTNPTTLGLFEKNIKKIAKIVHDVGGLLYYDGANLNPIMGVVRPGDMGFDVVHLNLHKTFSTPHGGGGPGSGPIGCKELLSKYLPNPKVVKVGNEYFFNSYESSIGKVGSFYGNFLVCLRALAYIETLGSDGIPQSAKLAVLNANYLKHNLETKYKAINSKSKYCMHEFVLSLEDLKKETGVSGMDVAKCLIDKNIHPPTMYFPLIVQEALMFEPTETESKETLDYAINSMLEIYELAHSNPEYCHDAPHNAIIKRPDETTAARNPILKHI